MNGSGVPVKTELFLDNQVLEATPGVSRRLHPAKKHLRNPVIRCDRWCDGDYLQPYTTMYDEDEKLFKMWARAGSDYGGTYRENAACMLYFFHGRRPLEQARPRCDGVAAPDHNMFSRAMRARSLHRVFYGPTNASLLERRALRERLFWEE